MNMISLDKKVRIPAYLHELHGSQASITDLVITYMAAVISAIVILYLAASVPLPNYKFILLGLLALDLAGGVVSNFTESTNSFYTNHPTRRYLFIALHIVQPLLLIWIFPVDATVIGSISLYTLIAVLLINRLEDHHKQRGYAAFLMAIGVSFSFLVSISQAVVHLMLVLFIIKLVVAFAVRWK
ncbi:hypothetical protein [Tunicatimonas pelagia]|uniref:hypothetical protein n=1 Tax=Tunicatimonas pelagia TaxID=931531 RepID=UPI002665F51E|nr:hypothetical protein [Tunicatimonas pelagia]WKN43041.1 hypothetical protein P0M28_28795 [Tunicatimonas pelagia]